MGFQASLWSSPAYQEPEEGSGQAKSFRASVSVVRKGQSITSSAHTASKRTLAHHRASLDLLAKLAGVEDGLPELSQDLNQEPSTAEEERMSPSAVNAVGQLYELKDARLIQNLHFDDPQMSDPHHQGLFICHCTVVTHDGRTLTGSGSGTTKKVAKQAAAMDALKAWVLDDIEQHKKASPE